MIILNNHIENLPALIELLSNVGHVVQVRCNDLLRESIKQKLGGEGVHIACLVRRRDNSDNFIQFREYFTIETVSNVDKHQQIAEAFKYAIDEYIYKDNLITNQNPETPGIDIGSGL